MGYTTDFEGEFTVTPPLAPAHAAYLRALADTRRMRRDPIATAKIPDPLREAVGLPLGTDCEFFVGGTGMAGQDKQPGIVDYNVPSSAQPSLWLQWAPSDDGATIAWDGGEKFYEYIKWIDYLVEKLLSRWGYTLSGTVRWRGDDFDDIGVIEFKGGKMHVKRGKWG